MSMRAYLCSQDARLRALVDEYGDDIVLLAVVEYRKLCVGHSAQRVANGLFNDGTVRELEKEVAKMERELSAARRDQDDAELDSKVQRERVLKLEALLDAERAARVAP